MKAVKLTWVDAESTTEWVDLEHLTDPKTRHTLGYLVKETDNTYFIAGSVAIVEDGKIEVGDTIAIPKGWVQDIIEIKEENAPKRKASRRT